MIALCEANDDLARAKRPIAPHPERVRQRGCSSPTRPSTSCTLTPNHVHFAIARNNGAGKHVISEKPLAMTTAESKELVSLAARAGVVNAIDLNTASIRSCQEAKAMSGIGQVRRSVPRNRSYTQDWLYLRPTGTAAGAGVQRRGRAPVADIAPTGGLHPVSSPVSDRQVCADFATIHPHRMKPKKEVETYSGKMLEPSITKRCRSIRGLRQRPHRSQQRLRRVRHRLTVLPDGRTAVLRAVRSKCSMVWNQDGRTRMWIGYREKPNEVLIKDPSLLSLAREGTPYPGGHPEAYPDG